MVHFTLYTRSYCHLCDDMLQALQSLSGEYAFTVELADVDADEDLLAQFDELVPVLLARKGEGATVRLCNYFFDEPKVRAFLRDDPLH
ncbi:MAG TPA: glutaredoxin family protein [Noviherbaspirillum sp.]